MNKKIKTLKADIDENKIKIYDVDNEIYRIRKTMRRKNLKHRKFREFSSRFNELKSIKTDLKNKIEALNQIIWHIEGVKDGVKLKIKKLKKNIKKLPIENPFDFTEFFENQNEENEIDLALFLELAENKIIYNQTPVNALIEDMEKLENGFFANGYFSLGDDGEIDTNRFL